MQIPENIGRRFDPAILARSGIRIQDGRATLEYMRTGSGDYTLNRQFLVASYPGRFESEMTSHYLADIKQEAERHASHIGGKGNQKSAAQDQDQDPIAGVKSSPSLETPQTSNEGPKRREGDEEPIEGFPDGTKEMKKLRPQAGKPQPKPKPLQQVFPVVTIPKPPVAPKVHIPPPPRMK